jgi:fido (protein-threonine AMPylation protein)/transcriptional regulator with XRE-family HTH domain
MAIRPRANICVIICKNSQKSRTFVNFIKFDKLYKVSYTETMEQNTNYQTLLGQLLTASGLSQDKLASRLGVSFPTLNSWVNGKSTPRPAAAKAILALSAEILGADSIDPRRLAELKNTATRQKYSVKKLLANREVLDQLTVGFTYHTNATEGSTMTEADVAAVLVDNRLLRNRSQIEQREAINHQTALHFLLDELNFGQPFQFTPDLIQSVHLRLLNGIISDAGHWREHPVRINGARVALANFIKIPELMTNWCNSVNGETRDPIGLLASSHAEFERIHPFSDGNGRTGRLLLFALALKLGLVPPILSRDRKTAYYKYLELAQTRDITDPLEGYIAECIIATADELGN